MSEFDARTYFDFHREADRLAGRGHYLASQASFRDAETVFIEALDMLSDGPSTAGTELQKAMIKKERGLAHARHALGTIALYTRFKEAKELATPLLEAAWGNLQDSKYDTHGIIRFSTERSQTFLDYEDLSPEALRYVLSEHGDTLSHLGDIQAISEAIGNEPWSFQSPPNVCYEDARDVLEEGVSRRCEMENTMRAVRYERYRRNYRGTLRWLVTSYFTAQEVEMDDVQDGKTFKKMFWGQLRDITTKERAKKAILQRS